MQRLPILLLAVSLFTTVRVGLAQTGWYPRGSAPTAIYLNDITYNPSDGSVYVSTPTGQLFKSQNNGNSWTQLNTTVPASNYEKIDAIADIAFEPVTESLVVGIGAGVYITPNDGGGWTHECFYQSNGQTGGCSNGSIEEVFFNGTSSILMSGGYLSASAGASWVYSIGSDVIIYDYFRGNNTNYAVVYYQNELQLIKLNGTSWLLVASLPSTMTWGAAYATKMDSEGNIFMVVRKGYYGAKGLFKSTDNGSSWTDLSGGLGDSLLTDIAIDGNDNIYLATEHNGIYRSTNGGGQWTSLNTGLVDTRINRIEVTNNNKLFALGETGGFYFFNTGTFAWEQRNNGLNATPQISHISFDGDNNLWAFNAASGVVYENTDVAQNTWVPRADGIANTLDYTTLAGVSRAADLSYFAYSYEGLFRYEETTHSWTNISASDTLPMYTYLNKVAAASGNEVFAFYFNAQGSKLRYTSDGGTTWEAAFDIDGITLYDMAALGSGKAVIALTESFTGNSWLVKVEQNGSSFDTSMVSLPLPASSQFNFPWPRIKVSPAGEIYVVILGTELWKFDFNAETFTQLPSGNWPSAFLAQQEPWLAIDDSEALWFSYPEYGVFYSADQGQSWSKRSTGYDSSAFLMNYIDFDTAGTAHGLIPAGIHYWGLDTFEMPVDTTDTTGNDTVTNPVGIPGLSQAEFDWKVLQYDDQLVIQLQTPTAQERLEVSVYDLMGRNVLYRKLGSVQKGTYRFALGSLDRQGVLAVRLRATGLDECHKIIH